jgi:hypothetical protein
MSAYQHGETTLSLKKMFIKEAKIASLSSLMSGSRLSVPG